MSQSTLSPPCQACEHQASLCHLSRRSQVPRSPTCAQTHMITLQAWSIKSPNTAPQTVTTALCPIHQVYDLCPPTRPWANSCPRLQLQKAPHHLMHITKGWQQKRVGLLRPVLYVAAAPAATDWSATQLACMDIQPAGLAY